MLVNVLMEQRVLQIKEDLELFDNDLDKYEYIIDLGKSLEPLDKDNEKDENLVQGCTSKVWLICEKKEDKLHFKANSNAMIVKGLVYILITLFSNLRAKEILDINLDVLKKLKANKKTQDIPVVMLTGKSTMKDMERAFHNGATNFIAKPFNGPELKRKVFDNLENVVLSKS